MQPLSWYARRLRSMTAGELPWRVRRASQDLFDPYLLERRVRVAADAVSTIGDSFCGGNFSVCSFEAGEWTKRDEDGFTAQWLTRLRQRADRLLEGRFVLFDRDDQPLGNPIDWNRDHKHGVAAPRDHAAAIDYRDFRVTGDAKFVWEPNRHHALVVLARAYRASGEVTYARHAVTLLEQWLDQCPYGYGMNWRATLELAIRLINWVWALDLIAPAQVMRADLWHRVLATVQLHLFEITRKYSHGTSANNHLIGEAAGAFMASSYFADHPGYASVRAQSFAILATEIERQTFADGGHREQALGYHFFVLQFFTLAGLVARATDHDFNARFWDRLHRMYRFLAAFCSAGSPPQMFGDNDDGYVLDLDGNPLDPLPWLSLAAQLFDDDEIDAVAPRAAEPVEWLPLPASRRRVVRADSRLRTHAFPDSGYYLLQHGQRQDAQRISVVFDCGPLGLPGIAAHGHADALSFTLRAAGFDLLVDAGTFDYFTHPSWRQYFRSTRAHNAIVVDDLDQSVMRGPFLWGRAAHARCLEWRISSDGGRVVAEHDGYMRLPDPVLHRRTLELHGDARRLVVVDDIMARGRHHYAQLFHFAAEGHVARRDAHHIETDVGPVRMSLDLDPQLQLTVLCGSDTPRGGWVSRGYHHMEPCVTLVGKCEHEGTLQLRTEIIIDVPGSVPERLPR